jgi:hypothetical protein
MFKYFLLGILKERDNKHIILKLVQPGIRGEREVNFLFGVFF